MGAIKVTQGLCKNCYACIRNCQVKATSIKEGQARVIAEDCLACGQCLGVCPQGAREIRSDHAALRSLLEGEAPVWASLAPSAAAGPFSLTEWEGALKSFGFAGVSLTAWGAVAATASYVAAADLDGFTLTTACPAAVKLVTRYFPDLARHLTPSASPMVNHGAWLKHTYGARVVFIGPCAAKKEEAMDHPEIDLALTFVEAMALIGLLNKGESFSGAAQGFAAKGFSRFPVPGSLSAHTGQPVLAVDGLDELIPFLTRLQQGQVRPHGIVEMSACRGSCLGGPVAFAREASLAERREALMRLSENGLQAPAGLIMDYLGVVSHRKEPDPAAIDEVLRSLGKSDPANEFNCGACGYHSCREKAAAVVQGRAELQMCLPYMRSRAESMANLVLASTPSAVVVVDKDLKVREWNTAAERLWGVSAEHAVGRRADAWLPAADFARVLHGEVVPRGQRVVLHGGRVAEVTYSLVRDGELAMGVYSDITDVEAREAVFREVRAETLQKAQEVIDKQMRVAHEIAGLLGETTAESKMLLLKLMKVVDRHE